MTVHRAATRTSRLPCWLLALLTMALGSRATAATPPLLKLDLRAWGAIGLQAPYDESLKPSPDQSLTFLDASTLAVSFPVFNPEARLGTRDRPGGSSVVFRTTLVDVHSGQVQGEKNWGSVYSPHVMEGISGERLLVRVGDDLGIYSRDWKLERQYHFKSTTDQAPLARVVVSPSGETVYVITPQASKKEHVDVLTDQSSGQWIAFAVNSIGNDAISDSNFAFALPKDKKPQLFVLPLKSATGQNHRALTPLPYKGDLGCAEPTFVADDLMVLGGLCESLFVVRVDGSVKGQNGLGERVLLHNVRTSRDQRRFALLISRPYLTAVPGEQGAFVFHGGRLRVYKSSPLSKLFEMEVVMERGEIRCVDFALSPDGSLLALMNGWMLTVYQLAAPDPSKPPAKP